MIQFKTNTRSQSVLIEMPGECWAITCGDRRLGRSTSRSASTEHVNSLRSARVANLPEHRKRPVKNRPGAEKQMTRVSQGGRWAGARRQCRKSSRAESRHGHRVRTLSADFGIDQSRAWHWGHTLRDQSAGYAAQAAIQEAGMPPATSAGARPSMDQTSAAWGVQRHVRRITPGCTAGARLEPEEPGSSSVGSPAHPRGAAGPRTAADAARTSAFSRRGVERLFPRTQVIN